MINFNFRYGIQLDSENSNYGHIKCRYQGNYIGKYKCICI